MNGPMHVQEISKETTYPLRLLVLRPGGVLSDTHFPNDQQNDAFHLGVFRDGTLISTGSFYPEGHPDLSAQHPFRLRGMATHPAHQGQGGGALLLSTAFEHLAERNADLLWCNARLKALTFYTRMGLATHGELFDIRGIGPHYLMYRMLAARTHPSDR